MTIRFYTYLLFSTLLTAGAAQAFGAPEMQPATAARQTAFQFLQERIQNLLPAQKNEENPVLICANLGELSPERRQHFENTYKVL